MLTALLAVLALIDLIVVLLLLRAIRNGAAKGIIRGRAISVVILSVLVGITAVLLLLS